MSDEIVLGKGKSIKFLDYIIKNSTNNDGLVLKKDHKTKGYEGYECHLGNFGEGTQENIDTCKRYAIVYFMLKRPEIFSTTLCFKVMKLNSGTCHEFFLLKRTILSEGLEMPVEIHGGDGANIMIYFKNKPLAVK